MKKILSLITLFFSISFDTSANYKLVHSPGSLNYLSSSMLVEMEQTPRVFGFTQDTVLILNGNPNGQACSKSHLRDDLSNRWCHGMIVKLADHQFQAWGVPKFLSALLSTSLFLPKEFLLDKNPSMGDLVMVEYGLYEFKENAGKIGLTLFADGGGVLSFQRSF